MRLFLIGIMLSTQIFAADFTTYDQSNCFSNLTKLFKSHPQYTRVTNLKKSAKEYLNEKLSPAKGEDLFNRNKHKLVKSILTEKILKQGEIPHDRIQDLLEEGQLYTFAILDDELRFAKSSVRNQILNQTSKHLMLADIKDVRFAGELWIYKDTIYISNSSGSYMPNSTLTPRAAKYFQDNFNIKKVEVHDESISDLATKIPFKTVLKSKVSNFSEALINTIAKNNNEGKVFNLIKESSTVEVEVQSEVGKGVYGIVHRLHLKSFTKDSQTQFPNLFSDNLPRKDLVIKFAHSVPILDSFPNNPFKKALLEEEAQSKLTQTTLKSLSIDGSEILHSATGENQFLIKAFIEGQSIQKMASLQEDLSKDQINALKLIYKKAELIMSKTKNGLDIKAENLVWDDTKKTFKMYEITFKAESNKMFYLNDGFDEYLNYIKQRLLHYKKGSSRRPSSSGYISLCEGSKLEIPQKYSNIFYSNIFPGKEIRLKKNEVQLKNNFVTSQVKCFKVSSLEYRKNGLTQMALSLHLKNNQRLIFRVKDTKSSEQFNGRFFIINQKNEIAAKSLWHELSNNK
jgi:hypothetical protein